MRTVRFSRVGGGFTVVELMIGVGIVALLSAVAVPGYLAARHYGMRTAYAHELRATSEAVQMYAADNGQLPESTAVSQVPEGMDTYLPKNTTWLAAPAIAKNTGNWFWLNLDGMNVGGNWDDFAGYIITAGVQGAVDQMAALDRSMDDGNSATGALRYLPQGGAGEPLNTVLYGVN